jgi:hypothetical protein
MGRKRGTLRIVAPVLLAVTLASPPASALERYRNNAMRVSGIVLTSIGAALLVGGVVMIATDHSAYPSCTDLCGFSATMGEIVMLPASVLFAGVGVPLWVVGARPPATAQLLPPAVPRVSIARLPGLAPGAPPRAAPAVGTLSWTF